MAAFSSSRFCFMICLPSNISMCSRVSSQLSVSIKLVIIHHKLITQFTAFQLQLWSKHSTWHLQLLPYSGKLSREKTFHKFCSFVAIRESFLHEIWGVASFGTAKASNPRKFSPRKSYFHQFAKVFSLESFPLYGNSFDMRLTNILNCI